MKTVRWLTLSGVTLLLFASPLFAEPVIVGNCGVVHDDPGCTDPRCEECVCDLDSFCCDPPLPGLGWDGLCVAAAIEEEACLPACEDGPTLPDPDLDGDGILDDEDDCLDSDLSSTVVIDGCDSGVANTVGDDGCTLADLLATCADGAHNRGQYVRCVSHLTNDMKAAGELTGEEKDALQSCAGQADIP
jgi:hypothetical protein